MFVDFRSVLFSFNLLVPRKFVIYSIFFRVFLIDRSADAIITPGRLSDDHPSFYDILSVQFHVVSLPKMLRIV